MINKAALDYLRSQIPFLNKSQDMNNALFDIRMNNYSSFGKVDMLNAFAQIELPTELRNYTSFRMGDRLFRYKRLPFGLSVSTHVF